MKWHLIPEGGIAHEVALDTCGIAPGVVPDNHSMVLTGEPETRRTEPSRSLWAPCLPMPPTESGVARAWLSSPNFNSGRRNGSSDIRVRAPASTCPAPRRGHVTSPGTLPRYSFAPGLIRSHGARPSRIHVSSYMVRLRPIPYTPAIQAHLSMGPKMTWA